MSTLQSKANKILSRPFAAQDPTAPGLQSEEADSSLRSDIHFSDEAEGKGQPPDLDVLGADPAIFSDPAYATASSPPPHVTKVDAAQAQRLEEWLYGDQMSGGLASVMQSSADKLDSAWRRGRK